MKGKRKKEGGRQKGKESKAEEEPRKEFQSLANFLGHGEHGKGAFVVSEASDFLLIIKTVLLFKIDFDDGLVDAELVWREGSVLEGIAQGEKGILKDGVFFRFVNSGNDEGAFRENVSIPIPVRDDPIQHQAMERFPKARRGISEESFGKMGGQGNFPDAGRCLSVSWPLSGIVERKEAESVLLHGGEQVCFDHAILDGDGSALEGAEVFFAQGSLIHDGVELFFVLAEKERLLETGEETRGGIGVDGRGKTEAFDEAFIGVGKSLDFAHRDA